MLALAPCRLDYPQGLLPLTEDRPSGGEAKNLVTLAFPVTKSARQHSTR